jgi:hypothetical protein
MGEATKTFTTLARKSEGNATREEGPWCRSEDNIKMAVKEIGLRLWIISNWLRIRSRGSITETR